MIVTKQGDVPQKALFEAIVSSLKKDYYESTKKILEDSDIKTGLTYIKSFGAKNQHQVRITLEHFEAPSVYGVTFSSNRGKQHISYLLEEKAPQTTLITYQQENEITDVFQKANQFLMEKILKKSLERQIDAQLTGMIKYVKENNQEIENELTL
ncbi:DUF3284 domain-containing protein [Streptococcus sp. CSL10205-OR2]|uniref:DUF3284 domain-containing protein n=1 Tax=Streptococcus sp. CSL10205-OR2 TaxID=2980558 RepID=UPI0021D8D350|nr:DUF3284 domain-containing protein [Streptococcus sp. CSL10205-OR2]MCU9533638.1 DUF3284 domain-containing protein [Streptococcus sp. CSL10205-OR2]